MKKQINEPDFIGGHGALTKQEEKALTEYYTKKKSKANKQFSGPSTKKGSRFKVTA